jgi:hypothetical protein
MGDVGPSNATWGYAFRGQRILAAALQQLVEQHNLGQSPAGATSKPRLLFGGCSAGARGAMVWLDFIQGMLQNLGVDMEARGRGAGGAHLSAWAQAAALTAFRLRPRSLPRPQVAGLLDSGMWIDMDPTEPGAPTLAVRTAAAEAAAARVPARLRALTALTRCALAARPPAG